MDRIKELTDFYMWMQENDYDHNIRIRVEKKAEMYLKTLKHGGKLPIHSVVCFDAKCMACEAEIKGNEGLLFCGDCGMLYYTQCLAKATFLFNNLIINVLKNKYSLELAQIRNIIGDDIGLSLLLLRECAEDVGLVSVSDYCDILGVKKRTVQDRLKKGNMQYLEISNQRFPCINI